jgi:poly-gamma-glutamate synthesis protein (capsule biosynthesis protein)
LEILNSGREDSSKYEDVTIKIVSVGGIISETAIFEDAYMASNDTYDFSHMFSNIKRHTLDSHITLGLLETNFVPEEPYSGGRIYNSPKALGVALKDIGINILHTSNNHSLDYGFSGIKSTIDYLEELGIYSTRNIQK